MDSGEKQKNIIEPGEKNEWSELEGLAQDGPAGVDISESVKSETQEERQERIFQAAAKVKESYKKIDTGELTPIGREIAEESPTNQIDEQQNTSKQRTISSRITSKYGAAERPRIDRIKADLEKSRGIFKNGEFTDPTSPSTITKAVRLMADRLGIKTKRSEEQREKEARFVAKKEYFKEEIERRIKAEEERKIKAEEERRIKAEEERRIKAEEERKAWEAAQKEHEKLAKDMAGARDAFDNHKNRLLRNQRAQEIVERDLNSRLLKIDYLETEVISENPEVKKHFVSFEGADIPVYDLKGIPFSILSTTVDYKNVKGGRSYETARMVLENPAVWTERRDEVEETKGFGTGHTDERADTICTSYWNSERNLDSYVSGRTLMYGFDHVESDSIIQACDGDGGTNSTYGRAETEVSSPDAISSLEKPSTSKRHYNEVTLRRYTENGMPKKPDYIIVEKGKITEESLRHAKFFKIPIVNVELSVYEEKANKKGEEIIASISEKDSYEELDKKIAELQSMSYFKTSKYQAIEDVRASLRFNNHLDDKSIEASKIELAKRLDYIRDALEETTRIIETATDRSIPAPQTIPKFDSFDVVIWDNKNGAMIKKDKISQNIEMFNSNHIDIDFSLKGSSRKVKTRVFDNSSYYDALEPIVRNYFEAFRKNQELKKG